MAENKLQDKVALVTGAGAVGPGWGNGKACAVCYARAGAKVMLVDRAADAVAETQAIIEQEGGSAAVFVGDVSDAADVAAMVAQCIKRFGQLDILHNNVGIVEIGGPVDLSEAAWRRSLDVNVTSMFLACKYAIPEMLKAGGGVITNISSIAANKYIGWPAVAYGASKGAVNSLTMMVAMQYAAQNIRCNAILPGLMHTPLVDASLADGYAGDDMIAQRHAQCPSGKMGDAFDVAHMAVFLASDQARYINGAQMVVDGGIQYKI